VWGKSPTKKELDIIKIDIMREIERGVSESERIDRRGLREKDRVIIRRERRLNGREKRIGKIERRNMRVIVNSKKITRIDGGSP
jgi:hypothetical protein